MPEPTLLDAHTAREQIITVDLGDGTCVRARRCDLAMMLFEGNVPTPLMKAAQRFIDSREMKADMRLMDDEIDRPAILEVLRQHAVNCVIDPVLVMEEDHVDTHVPVRLLTLQQLFMIWNQTALTPRMEAAEAASFRVSTRATARPVLRTREGVRPRAEPVGVERDVRSA
jgi:hypothetical protein